MQINSKFNGLITRLEGSKTAENADQINQLIRGVKVEQSKYADMKSAVIEQVLRVSPAEQMAKQKQNIVYIAQPISDLEPGYVQQKRTAEITIAPQGQDTPSVTRVPEMPLAKTSVKEEKSGTLFSRFFSSKSETNASKSKDSTARMFTKLPPVANTATVAATKRSENSPPQEPPTQPIVANPKGKMRVEPIESNADASPTIPIPISRSRGP